MHRKMMAIISIAVTTSITFIAVRAETGDISSQESERIIQQIYEKGIPIYKQYRGVESLRSETVNEYDPETKKLRRSTEVTMQRKDYYYTEPEIKVLTCKTDGKETDPSKFRVMKSLPTFPAFDEKGKDNYNVTVIGKKKIDGRECYQVSVEPKKETPRHFKGSFYFTTDKLESVMVEGTLAKLSFPIKEFSIKFYTRHLDNVPVVTSGEVHVRVKVPIFYPDTMIVTTIAVKENKLIQ